MQHKEIDVEVNIDRGAIVAMRSQDPDSNYNTINVTGYNDSLGEMQYVKLQLNSNDYKKACDAHVRKKSVRVVGTGRSSIKQVFLRHPDEFQVNE